MMHLIIQLRLVSLAAGAHLVLNFKMNMLWPLECVNYNVVILSYTMISIFYELLFTEQNLPKLIFELFAAGTETTSTSLR